MSESTVSVPERARQTAQPPGQESEDDTAEFERRRKELTLLLTVLDRELWKCGLPATTDHDFATGASSRTEDDVERQRVREMAATMFRELEFRLAAFADTCAHLAEDERANLAEILRLPEAKRRAIMAILGLPKRERNVLHIAFALSEAECHALAELLQPTSAPPAEKPSITIIDPSILEEEEGKAPSVA
jgi:hypothetical protein